jgi:hypothetical protein
MDFEKNSCMERKLEDFLVKIQVELFEWSIEKNSISIRHCVDIAVRIHIIIFLLCRYVKFQLFSYWSFFKVQIVI